jgi:glycosyltransferase involved in cell wall biosynthesis
LIFLAALALASLGGGLVFLRKIENAAAIADRFRVTSAAEHQPLPSVTIVIPAYNEAVNIQDCITAALQACDRRRPEFQVWVVDDQSSDDTLTIAQSIQDPRLTVISGQPRPTDQTWVGKNWACAQVTDQIQTDYILFIDADVRLSPGAIDKVLPFAIAQQSDLLCPWITLLCGCWAEWFCQPVVINMFVATFELEKVNDGQDPMVMAAGPFLLFRRSAYEKIGGHRGVASEVAEDVELARRIKQAGLHYWYGLGNDLGTLRMYRNFAGLWEGWTKNWFVGTGRQIGQTLFSALVAFLVFAAPSAVLVGVGLTLLWGDVDWLTIVALMGAIGTFLIHYRFRQLIQPIINLPPDYWWTNTLGGWIMTIIPLVSWLKTQTGWGWTWRGRSLKGN